MKSWTKGVNTLHYLLVCVIIPLTMVYSQPFNYYFKFNPTYQVAGYSGDLHRVNLLTSANEILKRDVGRVVGPVFWNADQTRLFLQKRFSVEIIELGDDLYAREILGPINALLEIKDAQRTGRYYVGIGDEDGFYKHTIILNRSTYTPIDTINEVKSLYKSFLSRDETILYQFYPDSTGIFFSSLSVVNNFLGEKKRYGAIGPFSSLTALNDGRFGRALVSYETHDGIEFLGQRYVVCDLGSDITYQPISFPWRSEGHLSGEAKVIILEQVNWDTTSPSSVYRPGIVYIFEAETGKLMQRLSLSPEGKVLVFDNFPDRIYYFNEQTMQSIPVDVTAITPTNVLLDTLIALKHQAVSKGWLIDERKEKIEDNEEEDESIVKQLDKPLDKAQKELVKGDSTKARKELEKFVKKVEELYKESTKEGKKVKPEKITITSEAYALLKYNAEYLIDRLQKKKREKDYDDKNKD